MLTLNIQFLAGRYHATPWGRHVNEADLSWPPEPWRILRALIAVWHRKFDALRFPETVLESLILKLASELPLFDVTAAIQSHTRHYMPIRDGKKEKRAMIYDAFLRVSSENPVRVIWRGVELDDREQELSINLADAMGYLGRAESWVEASVSTASGDPNCFPANGVSPQELASEKLELVTLQCPRSPTEYDSWRSDFSKDPARQALTGRQKRRLDATLPSRLLDALRVETSELRATGWSQAPASTAVRYARPSDIVRPFARSRPRRRSSPKLTTARLMLAGKPLPRFEDAVRVAECVRRAVLGRAKRILGPDRIPPCLSGHDLPEKTIHAHAFYLPEPDPRTARISHILIHAEMGLDSDAQRVLDALPTVKGFDGQEWRVLLENIAGKEALSSASPFLSSSKRWVSITPYLHPWHAKSGFGVDAQIRRECQHRGFPEVDSIEVMPTIAIRPGRQRRAVHFHRFRSRRGLTQPDTRGRFCRLEFAAPIAGPLALGFGAHFGLGMFVPEA